MSINEEIRVEEFVGTWKLVSAKRTIIDTGETFDVNQPDNPPSGFLTYGNDGRMMVLNLAGQRPQPASAETITDEHRIQLFRTMVAYAGTYTFDGRSMFHHIDISWNELWTGTTQVRTVTRDGDRLAFVTSPAPGVLDGKLGTTTLVWQRYSSHVR
jgi:hypothetical protein